MKTILFERDSTYSLRGICMLMIIFSHISQVNVPYISGTIHDIALLVEKGGFLGTSVFLLLSGYGCFLSFSKNSPFSYSFIINRLWKIFEPFIVGSFFVFLFCIIKNLLSWKEILMSFFSLSIAYEFPLPHPNTNMWFLKIIILYYLISLLVFKFVNGNLFRVAIITIVISALCLYMWVAKYPQFIYVLSVNFPLGMLIGLYKNELISRDFQVERNKLLISNLISLSIFLFFYSINSILHNPILAIVSSISFSVSTIFFVAFTDINNNRLYFIGKKSIYFYVFHIVLLYPIGMVTKNLWLFSFLLLVSTFLFVSAYLNFKHVLILISKNDKK